LGEPQDVFKKSPSRMTFDRPKSAILMFRWLSSSRLND